MAKTQDTHPHSQWRTMVSSSVPEWAVGFGGVGGVGAQRAYTAHLCNRQEEPLHDEGSSPSLQADVASGQGHASRQNGRFPLSIFGFWAQGWLVPFFHPAMTCMSSMYIVPVPLTAVHVLRRDAAGVWATCTDSWTRLAGWDSRLAGWTRGSRCVSSRPPSSCSP